MISMSTRTGQAMTDPISRPYLEHAACGMISPASMVPDASAAVLMSLASIAG